MRHIIHMGKEQLRLRNGLCDASYIFISHDKSPIFNSFSRTSI